MSLQRVKTKLTRTKNTSTGWDQAISDAKEKIKGLEWSIGVFQQRKEAGEKWPGETDARQQIA